MNIFADVHWWKLLMVPGVLLIIGAFCHRLYASILLAILRTPSLTIQSLYSKNAPTMKITKVAESSDTTTNITTTTAPTQRWSGSAPSPQQLLLPLSGRKEIGRGNDSGAPLPGISSGQNWLLKFKGFVRENIKAIVP